MELTSLTGLALGTVERMQLLASALMVLAGLLPLIVPLRHLRLPHRPWTLIAIMLSMGLFGAIGPLTHGLGLSLWVEVAGVAAQAVTLLALLCAGVWLRMRAGRQAVPPNDAIPRLDDPDLAREVRALLAGGDKIAAIRRVREKTGAGLAEAKRAVESM